MRKSGGTAIAVSDDEIMAAVKEMASRSKEFSLRLKAAAALAAYQKLLASGFLKESDQVVLFNTGSGYKYLDVFAKYWGVEAFRVGAEAAGVEEHRRDHRAVLEDSD